MRTTAVATLLALLAAMPRPADAAGGAERGAKGPTVHFFLKKPEPDKGVVKLARHENTTTTPVGNGALITTLYEEVCAEPCGIPVDVSERPVFFFIRDGVPVSHPFRLHDVQGEVTLKVKPLHKGMWSAGFVSVIFLVGLPWGIPLLIASRSRVWIANGRPGPDLDFTRLRKARF